MRYMRFYITKGYEDPFGDVFSTSVRDIRVWIFNNRAKGKMATSDSTWNYPGSSAVDGSNATHWLSRFGTDGEDLEVDLGSVRNVAGVSVSFGYGAREMYFYHATNTSLWYPFATVPSDSSIVSVSSNGLEVYVSSAVHFTARYIRLNMQ